MGAGTLGRVTLRIPVILPQDPVAIMDNDKKTGTVAFAQLPEIYGHSNPVFALEFNCNGSLFASGSKDKTIRVWPSGQVRHPLGDTSLAAELT